MIDPTDYAALSALDIARRVRRGEFTAVEVVTAALGAIGERDDDLNAFTEVWTEEALDRAAGVDAQLARGAQLPLRGVPIGVKASEGPSHSGERAGRKPPAPRAAPGWPCSGHTRTFPGRAPGNVRRVLPGMTPGEGPNEAAASRRRRRWPDSRS
ncbi:amidase family protein [Streptomyces sp. WMMC940]|uniref:amidase family protein n=1 Tax=Streptomyces sp. WMMC940 TaxID=3015153 RepID=UPI0022B6ADEC|nr:amidase family protein [Streptomyces sp. WMMC940]MCZ7462401.1 amidase family protein [Streptomyces sp. WMMC940]